jgi:putative peptidoglycan lipid II flippase
MSLAKAFTTISGLTMLSRVVGFIRDSMLAAVLGAGPIADAFLVAFRLPNFFRQFFGEGTFNAAFVPQYTKCLKNDGKQGALLFAEQALAVLVTVLIPFLLLVEIGMPYVIHAFASGFGSKPDVLALAIDFCRITFPYLFFVSLVTLLSSLLNAHERFAVPASMPTLLNAVMIVAMLLRVGDAAVAGYWLSWSITLAGVLQLAWCWRACKKAGVQPRLRRPALTPEVRTMLRRMVPVSLGAGGLYLSVIIDMQLASYLDQGAISYLYFADRLNQLPLGVIGVALGTSLIPLLSKKLADGDHQGSHHIQNRAIELGLAITLPAAIGLLLLAFPIIVTLFQRGKFLPTDAIATAATLQAYVIGLPAYVLIKVFTPGFYAHGDTRTPVKIALAGLGASLILKLLLIWPMAQVGIALATALSSWGNVAALAWLSHKRGYWLGDFRLRNTLQKIVIAALSMALLLALTRPLLTPYLDGHLLAKVIGLGVIIAAASALYFLLLGWMRVYAWGDLARFNPLKGKSKRKAKASNSNQNNTLEP